MSRCLYGWWITRRPPGSGASRGSSADSKPGLTIVTVTVNVIFFYLYIIFHILIISISSSQAFPLACECNYYFISNFRAHLFFHVYFFTSAEKRWSVSQDLTVCYERISMKFYGGWKVAYGSNALILVAIRFRIRITGFWIRCFWWHCWRMERGLIRSIGQVAALFSADVWDLWSLLVCSSYNVCDRWHLRLADDCAVMLTVLWLVCYASSKWNWTQWCVYSRQSCRTDTDTRQAFCPLQSSSSSSSCELFINPLLAFCLLTDRGGKSEVRRESETLLLLLLMHSWLVLCARGTAGNYSSETATHCTVSGANTSL